MNKVFYFSGTGNSYCIAKTITGALDECEMIPINYYYNEDKVKVDADTIGIVFPVYFYNAPKAVKDFFKKLKIKDDTYVYLIATMGDTSGNAVANGISILKRQGIHVNAGFEVALPNNSIVFSTKPEKIDKLMEAGEDTIKNIIESIKTRVNNKLSKNYLYNPIGFIVKSHCINNLGFKKMKVDKERCTSCGLCEKICPMNNIQVEGEKISFDNKCEMCFACIHRCPQKAIGYKKMKMDKDYQIVNPNVDVKDMMWR